VADGSLFGALSTPKRIRSGGMVIDLYAGGGGASQGIQCAEAIVRANMPPVEDLDAWAAK